MNPHGDDPNLIWQPPVRPEWVQRIIEEGECMDIKGVVPLDERTLREVATRSTGLFDFGDPEWLEPFRVYLKALDEEADLNLLGRLRVRNEILLYLKARLQIEDTYKRHPEIGAEEILQPIIVVGQARCGTSLLQNVLAANPEYGTLRHWEMLFPCPPPEAATYRTDPRIELAERWISQWNRVLPTLPSLHEFTADAPFECTVVMSMAFSSDAWLSAFAQVPSFHAHLARSDPLIPLRFHRRLLKLLQWKNPRAHWVLRDISHLGRLEALLKIYPDACFIWSHRDPVRATASFINMLGTMQWAGSNTPLRPGSLEALRDPVITAGLFNSVIDLLERGAIPPHQICHVHYTSLVADTMGTLDRIHQHFGIPLSESGRAAMAQYLADNPRDARSPHHYPVRGEALARARQAYKRYQEYFKIPNE